ncbi:MAG: beta strand repeat-containing protein, partial [Terriglobia bacterium]
GVTMVNEAHGTIDANSAGGSLITTLTLEDMSLTNQGLVEATNNGVLQIGVATTVNNAGGNITANGAGAAVQLFGNSVIQGGTLNTLNGGTLGTAPGGQFTLDGSTAAGAVTIKGTYTAGLGSDTFLVGTINNQGNIQVNGGDGSTTALYTYGSPVVTLEGRGTVTLNTASGGGQASLELECDSCGGLTLENVNNTIQGAGSIGNYLTLKNDVAGKIVANAPGQTLQFGFGTLTNNGTMEATAGGTLQVTANTSLTNFSGNTLTGGTFIVNGTGAASTMMLSVGNGKGGEIVNNAANIVLDGANANVSFVDGNGKQLLSALAANTTASSGLMVENGYTFTTSGNFSNAGTVTAGNGGTFVLGGATLTSTGTLSLSGTGLLKGSSGTQTLTSSGTIEGSGNVGDAMMGLVNTGTILADQSTALVIDPNSAGFNNKGNLLVNAGSTLDITGPANSFLNFNSTSGTLTGGDYTVLGTLQFDNANIVTNAATITLLGASSKIVNQSSANALANFATNAAGGMFTLAGGRNFTTAGNFTNNGGLVVDTGSKFTVNGNLTNFSGTTLTGGTYRLYGGTLQFNGANIVTNDANITLSGTTSQIIDASSHNALANFATNAAMASFILQGGQDLTTAASFTDNGYLSVDTNSTFTVGNGGKYTQNSSGALDIAIAGTTASTKYELDVTGAASLNGALDISLVDGFVPKVGATFDILNGSSVTCASTLTENGLSINSSEHFAVVCSGGEVMLDVDSGALGPSPVLSGTTQPDSPTATPEPGSVALLGTALLALFCAYQRRLAGKGRSEV